MGGVHACRERAEVVVEEPGVDVEGHRGRGVTEHPLDRLDVRAAGHQQAGGGVPQVVRTEVLQPGRLGRRVEDRRRKLPERSTAPPGEIRTRSSRPLW
jgi:hypothetical protein